MVSQISFFFELDLKFLEIYLSGKHTKYFKILKKNQEETQRNHFFIKGHNLSRKTVAGKRNYFKHLEVSANFPIFLHTGDEKF